MARSQQRLDAAIRFGQGHSAEDIYEQNTHPFMMGRPAKFTRTAKRLTNVGWCAASAAMGSSSTNVNILHLERFETSYSSLLFAFMDLVKCTPLWQPNQECQARPTFLLGWDYKDDSWKQNLPFKEMELGRCR